MGLSSKSIARVALAMFVLHGYLWAQEAEKADATPPLEQRPIMALRPVHVETIIVADASAHASIVCPAGEDFAALADKVARRVRALSGVALPVLTANEAAATTRGRHLILLGNMANNPVEFDLYVQHYTACDALYPGEGGYVVRTVHDPWGTGHNAIVLGGSDVDGVAAAVDAFLEGLEPGNELRVPRLMNIHIPGVESLTAATLAKQQDSWRKRFVKAKCLWYGATHDLRRVGEQYHLTGKEAYAQLFAQMARRWIEEYRRWTPERQITTPKYAIPRLILTWDTVEESPFVPDDLKLDMLNLLYDYVKRMARHSRIRNWRPGEVRHTGHLVCLSVLYGARYFRKYYPSLPMQEIDRGLQDIAVGMATLARTPAVLSEDGYWHFHPDTIAHYALATGSREFFDNGMGAKMCEYAALCTSPLGTFHGNASEAVYVADWLYRDPRWKWLAAKWHGQGGTSPTFRDGKLHYEPWTFPYAGPTRAPVELTGVTSFPLDPIVYRNIAARRGKSPVPPQRAFRQAALRAGFSTYDQYILLDGINVGLHKVGDGNAIHGYFDRGSGLLTGGKWGSQEMKYQNTVLVLKDGKGPESLPVLAELMLQADLRSFGFLQSRMPGYNGVDWYRTLTWIKNECLLVTDTLKATDEGEYAFSCQWRTVGDPKFDGRAFTNERNGTVFTIKPLSRRAYVVDDEGVKVLRATQAAALTTGQTRSFAHVLYSNPDTALPRGWRRWQSSPKTAFIDRTSCRQGRACLTIKTDPPHGWQCLVQRVELPANTRQLVLSAAARTNGRVGARAHVTDAGTRRVLASVDFDGQDWQAKVQPFVVPPGSGPKLEVWAGTTSYRADAAQVWLDDLALYTSPAQAADGNATQAKSARPPANLLVNSGFETIQDNGRPARDYDIRHINTGALATPDQNLVIVQTGDEPMISFAGASRSDRKLSEEVAFRAVACVITPTRFAAADADLLVCGLQLLKSDSPVSIELDLATGRGAVVCDTQALVQLPCPNPGSICLDGDEISPERGHGLVKLALAPGRHVFDLPPFPTDDPVFADIARPLLALAWPPEGDAAATAIAKASQLGTLRAAPTFWKWTGNASRLTALASGPLKPGGRTHVAAGFADGTLAMLSPDGKVVWRFQPRSPINDVAISDLDGDGSAEIVAACDNHRVYCLDAAGKKKWEFSNQKFDIKRQLPGEYGVGRYVPADGEFVLVRAVDLDGDGKREVVAGSNTFKHGRSRVFGTLYALADDGKVLWHTYQSGGNPSSIDFRDLDGDHQVEIALATGGPTYARSNYLLSSQGELIHHYRNPYGPERIRFARFGPSARPCLVTADERSGVVSVLDATEPYEKRWAVRTGAFKIQALEVADLDGDGTEEAVVVTLDGTVYALSANAPGHVLWRQSLGRPLSAACIIPAANTNDLPAVCVGGIDGSLALVSASGAAVLGKATSAIQRMTVADIDGDGRTEPVAGTEEGEVWALQMPSAATIR